MNSLAKGPFMLQIILLLTEYEKVMENRGYNTDKNWETFETEKSHKKWRQDRSQARYVGLLNSTVLTT